MKILADDYEVTARSYYYLLDWNEQNEWRYISDNFGKEKLKELIREEYLELFQYATNQETNLIK